MRHGGMLLVTAAVLACTACLGEAGKLEVRSTSSGLKAGREPVHFRVAEAHAHLALGNVALALEGFRKAVREDPASVEALAGIAACYDRMQRADLSRRYFEMALAVAPRDAGLLAAFAASLDRQGLAAEAQSVRREMAALAEPAAQAPMLAQAAPVAPAAAAPVAPETAAPVGQSVTIALPPPRPMAAKPTLPAEARAMAVAPIGRSVTIALPAPRPASPAGHRQPRLERLSLTEVALVTGNGPRWKAAPLQPLRSATRIVPSKALEVRLLNAARVDKLAARTRTYLGRFGWRDIAVGDAAAVRSSSLIVYPQGTRQAASRLSARLGFAMSERADVRQLTILLGRDAAGHPGIAPQGMIGLIAAALLAAEPVIGLGDAVQALQSGRLEQARIMLDAAVKSGAQGEEVDRLVAELAFRSGDYAAALRRYETLVALHPQEPLTLERAGIAAIHAGDLRRASAALNAATGLPGASWRAWSARGAAADRRRDWDDADLAYGRAMALAPDRAEVLNNHGWSLMLRGQWAEALPLLERAAAIDPKSRRTADNLELARAALAEDLPLRHSGESDSDWSARLNDAGVIAAAGGDRQRAIAAFAQALEASTAWFDRAANNLAIVQARE